MGSSIDDLISCAVELAENDTEIYQRTASSKAYYACYHTCLSYADDEEIPTINEEISYGKHEELIRQFIEYPGTKAYALKLRSIGNMLKAARDIRTLADYRLSIDFISKDTTQVIGYFNSIIETINE